MALIILCGNDFYNYLVLVIYVNNFSDSHQFCSISSALFFFLIFCTLELIIFYLSVGSDGTESARNAGDLASTPGLVRSPGEGNGNPLQYPCLENLMDTRAWRETVHGVPKSQT